MRKEGTILVVNTKMLKSVKTKIPYTIRHTFIYKINLMFILKKCNRWSIAWHFSWHDSGKQHYCSIFKKFLCLSFMHFLVFCRGNLKIPQSIWLKDRLSSAHPSPLSPSAPPLNLLPPLHPRGAAPLVFHPAVAHPPRGPTSRARPVPSPARPLLLLAPRRSAPTLSPTTCLNLPNPRTRGVRASPRRTTRSPWSLVRKVAQFVFSH